MIVYIFGGSLVKNKLETIFGGCPINILGSLNEDKKIA